MRLQSWSGAGEEVGGAFGGDVPGVSPWKGQKELARHTSGQSCERVGEWGQSTGTEAEPSEAPLRDSKGWIIGDDKLEFHLAVARSRFKASSTVKLTFPGLDFF